VLGLVVGLLAGLAIGAASVPGPSASAQVAVAPDPPLPGQQLDASQPDRFVQQEALVLSGEQLRDAVRRELGDGSDAVVTATQVGTTDVIELSVTAETGARARSAAETVVRLYQQQRRQQLQARVDAAVKVVEQQVAALGSDALFQASPAEYDRLVALRNQLALTPVLADDVATLVQSPLVTQPSRSSSTVRGGVTGAVLGAVLGLVAALLLSRSAARGGSARETAP
jgi:hypothetical protein